MGNAVKDGIGESRVLNLRMPLLQWQLSRKQAGALSIATIEEVEEFTSVINRECITQPLVENQQFNPIETFA